MLRHFDGYAPTVMKFVYATAIGCFWTKLLEPAASVRPMGEGEAPSSVLASVPNRGYERRLVNLLKWMHE